VSAAIRQDAALEPVRAAMLSAASANAARNLTRARAAAAAQLQEAGRAADEAVATASAEGAASARPTAMAEVARSRRIARSMILEAEQATYRHLAGTIRTAVLGLRDQPSYPQLWQRLIGMAGDAAGPDAVIADHDSGGVVATAPGVVVDCSLDRLADLVITSLESSIIALCASSPPDRPHTDE
jgi:hypothetical protein